MRSPTLDAYLLTYYLLTYLLNYSLTCGRQERPAPNTNLLTYSLTCIPTYLLMTYALTSLLAEAARAPVHHVHVLIYLLAPPSSREPASGTGGLVLLEERPRTSLSNPLQRGWSCVCVYG